MLIKSAHEKREVEAVAQITGNVPVPSQAPLGTVGAREAGFRQRKNLLAMQDLTAVKLVKLRTEHPEWALKDTLAEVIKSYPSEIPSDVLLQLTQFIFGQWEKAESLRKQVSA